MAWIAFRVLLMIGGASAGPRVARWYPEAGLTSVGAFFALMLAVGFVGPVILVAIVALGRPPGTLWRRPSWRSAPYPGGPVLVVHVLAWYFIAGGLSALVAPLWVEGASLLGGAALAGLGTGALAACHLSCRLFPRAFS
jgi:hypothetical protein